MADLEMATRAVVAARQHVPAERCVLVAVSGIDASGKGWVASRLAERLAQTGLQTEILHADDWLARPVTDVPWDWTPEQFYREAIRFDALFAELDRRLASPAHAASDARVVRNPAPGSVVILEGVFVLQRAFRPRYDFSIWVDCSFETALERAIARNQEGLSAEATAGAFERLYFPAQRLHFALDAPRASAALVVDNDPRLTRAVEPGLERSRSVAAVTAPHGDGTGAGATGGESPS